MTDSTAPWIVVGLGNPGVAYAEHRHNVGAMVVQAIAAACSSPLRSHSSRCQVAQVRWPQTGRGLPPAVVLAQPQSYMNESGGPVSALLKFYKADPSRLVVVHDELDIPFATLRLKLGGGSGGHNGLRSISASLGTPEYTRVRVGIGRPPGRMEAADFVLRGFTPTEKKELPFLIGDAVDSIEGLVTEGLVATQQKVHAPR